MCVEPTASRVVIVMLALKIGVTHSSELYFFTCETL